MKILSLIALIFSPLIAGLLILCPLFPNHPVKIRRFAKYFASGHLIYSLLFLLNFDSSAFVASYPTELTLFGRSWLETLGIKASFAVDGLSLMFIILTSFITFIALLASKSKITYTHKLYYAMFLLAETSILGLLASQDMFVFFFFMELSLIPLYFLISHWSVNEDEKMARKFLSFNILGGFFILTPLLVLYFYNFTITETLSAGIETLNFDNYDYPAWFQISVFSSLLIGFLIRIGFFPFHRWLIECIEAAKVPVSIFLISCFSLSGVYGLLRFNIGSFPDSFMLINNQILLVCLFAIIYLVFLMTKNKNLKSIFAYFSLIQSSVILLGLAALNSLAYNGAIFLAIASSITTSGLLVISQIIERREKRYELPMSNYIAHSMPRLKYFSYIIFFSAIMTPCLLGFVAAFLLIFGMFFNSSDSYVLTKVVAVFAAFMICVSYIFLISVFHQMLFSDNPNKNEKLRDLTLSEMTQLGFISGIIILLGISPMSVINIINSTSQFIINVFRI